MRIVNRKMVSWSLASSLLIIIFLPLQLYCSNSELLSKMINRFSTTGRSAWAGYQPDARPLPAYDSII
jgi:hypothetical protein